MKTVLTNHELPHIWAHQQQSEGRNSNGSMFFRDTTIYSYGTHFPMATIHQHNGERVYFVTTRSYSVTTSHHVSRVRQAIPSLATTFLVNDPRQTPSEQISYFQGEVDAHKANVAEAKNKVSRAKRFGVLAETVAYANRFSTFFGLDVVFTMPENPDALKAEYDIEQEKKRVQREEREERQRKEYEERMSERLRKAQSEIEEWKQGLPDRDLYFLPKTFLRVKDNTVQTSKGAEFPVSHALAGLRLVQSVVKPGTPYVHSTLSLHLGAYRIDSIDTNGNVRAGCHYVEYAEIQRIAEQLETSTVQA